MTLKLAGFSKQPCCSRLQNLSTLLELHVSPSLSLSLRTNTHTHTIPINTTKKPREASTRALIFLPHSLPSSSTLSTPAYMGGSTNLPPGFHFFPSDEELVIHFLRRKAALLPCRPDIVPTLPQNRYDPWELNALQAGNQWYFFSQATQSRTSRNGCWNPIGADEAVSSGGSHVGLKKTLVFSIGEPFQATKTNWVMHEYHLLDGNGGTSSSGSSRKRSHKKKDHPDKECSNWVVCRVFESSYDSQVSFHEEDMELSCLDEVFLSLDDYDEVSLPKN
ncbi:hypothetical protein CFC21_023822 [Triticum aestivum]|uniref:NAC domain-containing protein n=2 Tax=Triticum aestivum TaxID=4565 RepID=A0A9R1EEV6_WHEAT|nr:hypothetical protein CFC21_023822 [Triticum aestivum]